jgi:hypothetical protein
MKVLHIGIALQDWKGIAPPRPLKPMVAIWYNRGWKTDTMFMPAIASMIRRSPSPLLVRCRSGTQSIPNVSRPPGYVEFHHEGEVFDILESGIARFEPL